MGGDGLQVRGGAGGVAVKTEAMHEGAGRLRSTGLELGGLSDELAAITLHPALLVTAGLDPAGAGRVADSAAGAATGSDGLLAVAAAVTALSVQTTAAAVSYQVAEESAQRALEGVSVAASTVFQPQLRVLTVAGVGAAAAAAVSWSAYRAVSAVPGSVQGREVPLFAAHWAPTFTVPVFDAERWWTTTSGQLTEDATTVGSRGAQWLANHPDVSQTLVAVAPAALRSIGLTWELDGKPGASLADTVRTLRLVGLFKQADRVSATVTSRGGSVPAPTDVASAVALAKVLGPARDGRVESTVRILKKDGRWIVIPPATQEWSPFAGSNPADSTNNALLINGSVTDGTRALAQAMREAGIKPGDPVMLVGHSQAGITAMDLASNQEFRDEFNVQVVLTAASPVAGKTPPPDVHALSLENDDIVPQLDGSRNPDTANVTTVRASAADLVGEQKAGGFHSLDAYGHIAEAVDRSDDPSIQAWQEQAAAFLDGGEAEEIYVEVKREFE